MCDDDALRAVPSYGCCSPFLSFEAGALAIAGRIASCIASCRAHWLLQGALAVAGRTALCMEGLMHCIMGLMHCVMHGGTDALRHGTDALCHGTDALRHAWRD
jgi:hypothetical protein